MVVYIELCVKKIAIPLFTGLQRLGKLRFIACLLLCLMHSAIFAHVAFK